jgi:hypothetical protein
MSNNEICIIMCIFGRQFTTVYNAPKNYSSYCFTNNKAIQPELENKGWKYIHIDFPLSEDVVESTLQVKYIKFLQFEKEERFSFFAAFKYVLVVDHKQELEDRHIFQILQRDTNKVFLKHHPSKDKSILIWHEVERSMYQERYLRNMPYTINYINEKIKQGYSEYACIPATGLIVYEHNDKRVRKLADEIYNDIIRVKMPNDQIVWALVSQKYMDIIQMIDANEIPVKWELPVNAKKLTAMKRTIKKIIKAFIPHGILMLYRTFRKV